MRQLLAVLALVVICAVPAVAEVWNDPSGITAAAASATVIFPRPFQDVLVSNDDAAESIHIRLFWCNATDSALYNDVDDQDVDTTGLEITAADKSRSFTYSQGENGTLSNPGYCALSYIRGGTSDVAGRVEGK